MSYETMWWDDVCCDFPGCGHEFDKTEGKRVAIVKDGKILAFCAKHSFRLIGEGVNLRSLSEIREERKGILEAPVKRAREILEQSFIQSLKPEKGECS